MNVVQIRHVRSAVAAALCLGLLLALTAITQPAAQAQVQNPPGLSDLPSVVLPNAGTASFGLELDPVSGLFHVTDTDDDNIKIVNSSGASVGGYGITAIPASQIVGQSTDLVLDYPSDIAIHGDRIYVAYFGSRVVVQYDRAHPHPFTGFKIVAGDPVGIGAHDDELYVTQRNLDQVDVYDISGFFNNGLTSVGSYSAPCANDVAVNSQWVYVVQLDSCASQLSTVITRHDRTSGNPDAAFAIGLDSYSIALSSLGQVFATVPDGMAVLDPIAASVVSTIDLDAGNPNGITIHPSGATAWVVERQVGATAELFGATGEQCGGQSPGSVEISGTLLTLFASSNNGLPPDSGATNAVCDATGPCTQVGSAPVAITGLQQRECDALEALYLSTNGASWTRQDGWSDINGTQSTDPCNGWEGVTCDGSSIVGINLPDNGLAGDLPELLSGFVNLVAIDLRSNSLTGAIPATVGDLTDLTNLFLYDNQLTGPLPTSLGELENLRQLFLFDNQIDGPLPTSLGELQNLELLYLQDNQLAGPIPTTIGGATSLVEVRLNNNLLTGSIPAGITDLGDLELLRLHDNQLTGALPGSIGSLTKLTILRLEGNQLSGTIPAGLGTLSQLEQLILSENQLTGPIPSLAGLNSLEILNMRGNQLTGSIPTSLGNLNSLVQLNLGGNQLTGPIPPELGGLSQLTFLGLGDNPLTGVIPSQLTALTNLTDLYLFRQDCLFAENEVTLLFYQNVERNDSAAAQTNCEALNDLIDFDPPFPVLVDVLANDLLPSDQITSFAIVDGPDHATASIENNQIRYEPAITSAFEDRLIYEICAGASCSQAELLIRIARPSCIQENGTIVLASIWGTLGDDSIPGTSQDDVIVGFDGDDTINAGAGDDIVCGNGGDDTINGEDGFDLLFGNGGNDVMTGGDGNDRLEGGANGDILRGGPGEDVVNGSGGWDRVLGGIGNDTMSGGDGNDYLGGFGGADVITGGPGNDTIFGGFGADNINGGPGNDVLSGLIGDDTINGGDGNDTINGDRGNDVLMGGPGSDTINGGNADDTINGGGGDDILNGGRADDSLSGDGGVDQCSGNKETVADTATASCELIFGVP